MCLHARDRNLFKNFGREHTNPPINPENYIEGIQSAQGFAVQLTELQSHACYRVRKCNISISQNEMRNSLYVVHLMELLKFIPREQIYVINWEEYLQDEVGATIDLLIMHTYACLWVRILGVGENNSVTTAVTRLAQLYWSSNGSKEFYIPVQVWHK